MDIFTSQPVDFVIEKIFTQSNNKPINVMEIVKITELPQPNVSLIVIVLLAENILSKAKSDDGREKLITINWTGYLQAYYDWVKKENLSLPIPFRQNKSNFEAVFKHMIHLSYIFPFHSLAARFRFVHEIGLETDVRTFLTETAEGKQVTDFLKKMKN